MADADVPAKHGTAYRSVALESAGDVERSGGEGLLRGECAAGCGDDPALVWVSAATSWGNAGRWDGHGRVFASDGWGQRVVLEKQSVSDADVHGRRRCRAPAMGDFGLGKREPGDRDSHCV